VPETHPHKITAKKKRSIFIAPKYQQVASGRKDTLFMEENVAWESPHRHGKKVAVYRYFFLTMWKINAHSDSCKQDNRPPFRDLRPLKNSVFAQIWH